MKIRRNTAEKLAAEPMAAFSEVRGEGHWTTWYRRKLNAMSFAPVPRRAGIFAHRVTSIESVIVCNTKVFAFAVGDAIRKRFRWKREPAGKGQKCGMPLHGSEFPASPHLIW